MEHAINFTSLMDSVGIGPYTAVVNDQMSGLEQRPKDDWLYLGLLSLSDLAKRKNGATKSAAFIGSGNGIDVVTSLKIFHSLKDIVVTDILPEIMPVIQHNVEVNVPLKKGVNVSYVVGRDCLPLTHPVDLIYTNLPLIMVSEDELNQERSTTTLTGASHYLSLAQSNDDVLKKYSLLSQLGFLISAKEKLKSSGSVITLIGGRVPYAAIHECFVRAGLSYRQLYCAFMQQSDPEFIKQYVWYENKEHVEFIFYDYDKAAALIKRQLSIEVPDVINGFSDQQLKQLLQPTQVNAAQAYQLYRQGKNVGHLAYAFEAFHSRENNPPRPSATPPLEGI